MNIVSNLSDMYTAINRDSVILVSVVCAFVVAVRKSTIINSR